MSLEDEIRFQSSKKCRICKKLFAAVDNKVKDHNHVQETIEVLLIEVVTLILNWLKTFTI